jgi:NADPH-dependent ferric siderophore reductase
MSPLDGSTASGASSSNCLADHRASVFRDREAMMVATVPQSFRLMRVEKAEILMPSMRRITFAGPHLRRFEPMQAIHCRLLVPPSDRVPVWPSLNDDGHFRPGNGRVRKYTIRRIDATAGRMEIDFLLHEPAGPGAAWAAAAKVGDELGLMGPGGGSIPLVGQALLLGDETALPAIARALEEMPDGTDVTAVIEIAGPQEEQALALPPGAKLQWLHRGHSGNGEKLAEAVVAMQAPSSGVFRLGWLRILSIQGNPKGAATKAGPSARTSDRSRLLAERHDIGSYGPAVGAVVISRSRVQGMYGPGR